MSARVLCTVPPPEPFATLLEPVSPRVLGRIPTPGELAAELEAEPADVLCVQLADRVDEALLETAGSRLRAVSLYSAGFDNVDVAAATRRRVAVGNTGAALTDATADCAVGLMLAAARRLVEGDAAVRRGDFRGWEPELMLGLDLRGALLGIVGFGRIGQAVARRALGFSMRVAHAARDGAPMPGDLRGRVASMPLERLLAEADVISLHVPLTPGTRHLIDAAALRRMRTTAILVNTARGAVVDEGALVTALREGWIAGAGLDVYENEPVLAPGLTECTTAVLAPHLGSATARTRRDMAELCALNVLDALAGRLPRSCVNPASWSDGPLPPLVPDGGMVALGGEGSSHG